MNKLHSIQYLRALAALSVVALHASKRVESELPVVAKNWFHLGHAGVDLFFVISGFIMWYIGRGTRQDPGGFLLRRVVRIAPLYWCAIGLWLLVIQVVGYTWIEVTVQHVMQSLLFIPHFNPTFPERMWPVLVPGWTLNYEMFFYLVFTLVLFLPQAFRLWAMSIALGGLVVVGLSMPLTQAWALAYTNPMLLEFLAGCLVAEIWSRWPGGRLRNGLVLICGVAAFAYLAPSVSEADFWARAWGFGLPSALILSGVVGLSPWLPNWPTLEKLGDASYAIYLFHVIVLIPCTQIWIRLPLVHSDYSGFAFVVAFLCLMSVVGIALFRFVEKPLQRTLMGWLSQTPRGDAYAKR